MSWWESIVLGFIQGATEFLPVSSSGHLVIGQALLGLSIPGVFFEVAVHVATLLSVLVVYRARVWGLVHGCCVRRDRESWGYVGLLALATVPAGLVGVLWKDDVEALFDSPAVVGWALLVTGALLFSTRWALRKAEREHLTMRIALAIGVAQAFALIPGISRSGSTVVAALWLGVAPVEAAAFSFLMSIPAIGGAAVLSVPDLLTGGPGVSTTALALGAVAAAVTGVLAIRTFVVMLKNRSFPAFAWYCWAAGGAFLVWVAFGMGLG
ncbi:MAG: undecaprenyl-diphosphate phosphatase [Gemmatimonadetes bacterium]|nr:undecaprenyl-diphosphate phosphatase [Gemmatimonadota bacterium]